MIMESLQSLVALVFLPLLILLPSLQFTTSNKTASFSLKLIHRDSPASPFYTGAMPFRERVERYLKMSKSRVSYWNTITMHNTTAQPNLIRPVVGSDNFAYDVAMEIGDPRKPYYLILDTGSGLTWLQCQPCQKCFPQKYEIYNPKNSKTFEVFPCPHPLCQYPSMFCTKPRCTYRINYSDKSFSQGYLATESIHFQNEKGEWVDIFRFLFGCSNVNYDFVASPGRRRAGIMGLDRSDHSFITLMGSYIKNRFSYCLINPLVPGNVKESYLKFGLDMGYIGGAVQITPFVKVPNSGAYALNLLDISVNFKRLNYPPGTFEFEPNGSGGFIIDSGSAITYIHDQAYPRLEGEILKYFSAFKQLVRHQDCPPPTRMCYNATMGYPLFPILTLHFQGADLNIQPENVVVTFPAEKFFTVAIAPGGTSSILGSFQQHNTRFTYDLGLNVLAFNPEDCSKDKA